MKVFGLIAVALLLSGCVEGGAPTSDSELAPSTQLSEQDPGNTSIESFEEPQGSETTDQAESEPNQTDSTEESSTSSQEDVPTEGDESDSDSPSETNNAQDSESSTPVDSEPPSEETVNGFINLLRVSSEFPSGYDRDLFRHWTDDDRDGCNAREEVLLLESVIRPTVSGDCNIQGRWISAFDGEITTNTSNFDVDHMVPLKEAWDSGAHAWSSDRREQFANDLESPYSLIAVSRSSNRSKGADDPAGWMPPNRSYWCEYVYAWTSVKIRWNLSADSSEIRALRDRGGDCLVSELNFQVESDDVEIIEDDSITPVQPGTNTLDPQFSSCGDAKAAGYGPYVRGVDPEYDWYRDGDSDGTVCE